MRIIVSQPSSEIASHAVQVFLNGEFMGTVGLDGVLSFEAAQSPYEVKAICGTYNATFPGAGDESLEIRWMLHEPYLTFVRKNKGA